MDSKDSGSYENEFSIPSWNLVDFSEIEIGDRIGGGGVGVIYKGWWKDEPVALKALFDPRISEDLKQEYMDELLIMSKLDHSNIVKFLGACMVPPNLCFVMEICECSLYHLLHIERPRLSDYEMVQMAIDISSAMEYLHSLRPAIIHRDLKALNVLKAYNGVLKLCDFGLVKVKHSQAGTPSYMAPELFQNRPFNKSVDVYAFGVLLWEIFTQDIPFNQTPVTDIRDKILSGDRPEIPSYGFPREITNLIQSCWHQNQEKRPGFTEIVDILLDVSKRTPSALHSQSVDNYGGDTLDFALTRK